MSGKKNPAAAIIGFGNIASLGHLPALRALNIDIKAVVDVCKNRRRLAEKEGLMAVESVDELAGLEIDFIDICTPPSLRYEAIKHAVENDLDIISEKPIATTAELGRIKKLVIGSDIFFYPIHNWKHSPHYQKAREMIAENGGLESLRMTTLRTSVSPGNPDWNPDWRVDKKIAGGGIIMDHGYHNIYLAAHLFGEELESAVLEDIEYFDDKPGIEKRALFSLLFPGNRKASIELDWCASKREIKNTIYECNHTLELSDRQLVNSEETYEFQESLSGDSVHGTWFLDVFSDFLKLRITKDQRYFMEAVKVLEAIDSLYTQATV